MQLPTIDPTSLTSLESLDLGDLQSADGRAHPITATTPVTLDFGTGSTSPVPSIEPGLDMANDAVKKLLGSIFSTDAGKRVILYTVVIVAALILLTVSTIRLTGPVAI